MFNRYLKLVIGYFVYGAAKGTAVSIHNLYYTMDEPDQIDTDSFRGWYGDLDYG